MKEKVLSENALKIAIERYFMEDEIWEDLALRLATHAASVENGQRPLFVDNFAEIIGEMDFLPGGRILRNIGRPRGSLFNCYVLPCGDSIEEIGQYIKDSLILWSEGGGVGVNISHLRPRGAVIRGKGGTSSGPVSFLEAANAVSKTIESGGSRRAAALACMNVTHPDILEFIDAKLVHGKLNHFNLSVAVDDKFLEAVEADGEWKFTFAQQYYGKIEARVIWDKIIENMVECAEPGLLHWGNLTSNNSYYFDPILSTNPCIVGETLIAVADGRNAVSIEQLAAEGKDVPVYSTNLTTGKVEIKIGRNPRKTGVKKEVWCLKLDDGSELIATPDHKILLKDGQYVKLHDLKPGMSIMPFNTFNSNGYRQICNSGKKMSGGARRNRRQYRLVYEFHKGEVDPKKFALHHTDFDKTNDSISNLVAICHEEHQQIHTKNMFGLKNPYYRMSDEWKHSFASHPGETNPRYSGRTNEEILSAAKELYAVEGKFTKKLWVSFAKKHGFPQNVCNSFRFNNFSNFKSMVVGNHKVISVKFVGYEDVYNITVDDNHNYNIITSYGDDKFIESSGICVKNCGEVPLAGYGVCDLGSLVLPNFITGNVNTNWKKLERVIKLAIRFLDNIIDINKYVLKEIDIKAHNARRVGLGVMGLAEYLFAKKLRYGSKKAIYEVERLMRFIRDTAYEASVELAIEKGAFPKFDAAQYGKAHFVRSLPASLRMQIKKHGTRNVTLMAMAPTGTISLLPEVTSGIEPLFRKAYRRSDRVSERIYVHPLYKKALTENINKDLDWFVDTDDLKPEDHFETQVAVQKFTDGAVSKTINMPAGTTTEELSRLTLEYIYDLKGVTVYVDGSREGQILNKISEEEVRDHLVKGEMDHNADKETVACATGSCEI